MLEVGSSSRGSTARFSIQQFIAKSFQMCGKGQKSRFCSNLAESRDMDPNPSPPARLPPSSPPPQRLPHKIPVKPPQTWQKHFPKAGMGGWVGRRRLFPMSTAITFWPRCLASPSGRGRYHHQPAALPRDSSFEGHRWAANCSFCLPRAPVSQCVIRDWIRAHA